MKSLIQVVVNKQVFTISKVIGIRESAKSHINSFAPIAICK
ncbi:MAG: hypothetical protein OFPII_41900 [Osedax symbiont Rs1]|nr:MAG: hypothetical protein OFPII_41900 [Osedax symbiont Rs1]